MKQVKELSLVQSVFAEKKPPCDLANIRYAAGFASADFIILNLVNEAKVLFLPWALSLRWCIFHGFSILLIFGRLSKFHVVDGVVRTLIILVTCQRWWIALPMSRSAIFNLVIYSLGLYTSVIFGLVINELWAIQNNFFIFKCCSYLLGYVLYQHFTS